MVKCEVTAIARSESLRYVFEVLWDDGYKVRNLPPVGMGPREIRAEFANVPARVLWVRDMHNGGRFA